MKALITGASSGIGREFAIQLADQGWDLAIVARRKGRLDQLASELMAQHHITVEVLECDLSSQSASEQVIQFAPKIDLFISTQGSAIRVTLDLPDLKKTLRYYSSTVSPR